MTFVGLLLVVAIGVGGLGSHVAYRRTDLSPRNWYVVLAAAAPLFVLSIAAPLPRHLAVAFGGVVVAALVASMLGHRWRQGALGAGGELREFELARRMLWVRPDRDSARRRIATQGELVTERSWPEGQPFVPMGPALDSAKVPRGEGKHILVLGGTGSGKTVSADRIAIARILADGVGALVLDPKGDDRLYADLRAAAAQRGVPFIVFDPNDPDTDRWDPLWSEVPGQTVARIVAPIRTSEPYYADTLRIHLDVVAESLAFLGLWPASMPLLLEAAQPDHFSKLRDLVNLRGAPPDLGRRIEEQMAFVNSTSGERDIGSGAARLRVVTGSSWRRVLTPDRAGEAVQLPRALEAGAIVLWRTWVEEIPEEAEAITTLALADAIAAAAAVETKAEWILVLEEYGSVLEGNAAKRGVGILGRARSFGGQAIVVAQSAEDIPTATENQSMLESMSDNFSAFVVHRQTSSVSREWCSKLFGTREIWQSTDRTGGGGRTTDGTGSRRRAREFVVRPDELKELGVGEAFVWTPSGPSPALVRVAPAPALAERPDAPADTVYAAAGPRSLDDYEPAVLTPTTDEGRSAADRVDDVAALEEAAGESAVTEAPTEVEQLVDAREDEQAPPPPPEPRPTRFDDRF